MKFNLILTKNRSDDFVKLPVEASDSECAGRLGDALAGLMGTDHEWCTKQERMLDKSWHCEVEWVDEG